MSRLQLHEILCDIHGDEDQVFFQPPESKKINYATGAIIYRRDFASTQFADNEPYRHEKRYQVIVVDPNPDSAIPDKVAALPKCVFDRHYTVGGLNHDVYKLFF